MAKKKKQHYETDPLVKLAEGKHWRLTVIFDDDNTRKIVQELKASGLGVKYYQGIVNKRVREAFAAEEKKLKKTT